MKRSGGHGPTGTDTGTDTARDQDAPGWGHALFAGLLWMAVLFTIDTIDSLGLINRGIQHIEATGQVAELLKDAVLDYVKQIAVGYLVMAIVAAVLVRVTMRVWYPAAVSRIRWWWTTVWLALLVTLLGYARQMVTFPPLQDWFAYLRVWVDLVTPTQVALVQAGVALALLGWRVAAWGRRAPRLFARRLLALCAVLALVALTQVPIPAFPPAVGSAASRTGPNVVLIGIDSLRPDHLSGLGYDRPTSPNIDALLAESVRFDSAWSQIARTYPAWTSMMTGSWPVDDQIRDNLPSPDQLVPTQPTVAQVLQRAGWYTTFLTDDSRFSYMVPALGWDVIHQPPVGLTNFVVSVNEPRYRAFHAFMHNPLGFALVPSLRHNQAYGKSYRPGLFANAVVRKLTAAAKHDRFFLAMHSCVLHHPGDRVWPYTQMFGQRGYAGENRFRYARSPTSFEVTGSGDDQIAAGYAEQDARIYDSGVVMADELVGRVMGALRAGDLLDNTIVVLFSDHGEDLWAPDLPYNYGGPNHGFNLMGLAQNRIVLAVRMPDSYAGPSTRGTVVSDPVRLLDLGPSLAELAGVSWPKLTAAKSLVPLIEGKHDPQPRLIYMETGVSEKRYWAPGHRGYPYHRIQERYDIDLKTGHVFIKDKFHPYLVAAKDRAVQLGRWRLIWFPLTHGTRVALYDIEADPLLQHDLAREEPKRVAWLGSQLAPFLRKDGESEYLFKRWENMASALDPVQMLQPRDATTDGGP
ncbi:MAG: sulfatase-like hydrolase/transferase [Oligoflexia bacterium]|nr:sulfatase-like hydrolase/transferase [Oligoflexia bacterium]